MLGGLVLFAMAAGGAYYGARRLIEDPALPDLLPEQLREPARRARSRLLEVRVQAEEVLTEMDRERAAAEAELRSEYLGRVQRTEMLDQ